MSYSDLVAAADRVGLKEFGEVITYKPASSAAVSVTGIFDAQYVLARGSAHAGVEAVAPAVFFRFSDLPVDPEVDEPTLTIRGVSYVVDERRPDTMGGIVLVLKRGP